jgi:hypothetical protein
MSEEQAKQLETLHRRFHLYHTAVSEWESARYEHHVASDNLREAEANLQSSWEAMILEIRKDVDGGS